MSTERYANLTDGTRVRVVELREVTVRGVPVLSGATTPDGRSIPASLIQSFDFGR